MVKSCAVVGGSGYIGGELMRLLSLHPNVKLGAVTANDMANFPVEKAHPNLRQLNKKFNALLNIDDAEIIFLALPHGKAMEVVPQWLDKTIIDTSGDFRLHSIIDFEQYYKLKHQAFEHTTLFQYGLPELYRDHIKTAKHVASPGCFATISILSLFPIVSKGLANKIMISAVTGSSGSGIKPKEKTNHAFRENSFFAYELFTHRHVPEIKQALFEKTGHEIDLVFQPHSGPFIRGIYLTAMITLNKSISTEELRKLYQKYYHGDKFVRVLSDESPNIKWIQQTNFCDIAVETNGHTAIITAAIDNLMKGGAAQAIQCFNIMQGLPETTGLQYLASNP